MLIFSLFATTKKRFLASFFKWQERFHIQERRVCVLGGCKGTKARCVKQELFLTTPS